MTETRWIDDHAPRPGPGYWDFRCLECSQPVREHASFWTRLWRRWLRRRARAV